MTCSNIAATDHFGISAVAMAQPIGKSISVATDHRNGNQSTETLSGYIVEDGHGTPLVQVSRPSDGLAHQRWPVAQYSTKVVFTPDQCRVLRTAGVDVTGLGCPPEKPKPKKKRQ
jgi:hypothetical protein